MSREKRVYVTARENGETRYNNARHTIVTRIYKSLELPPIFHVKLDISRAWIPVGYLEGML